MSCTSHVNNERFVYDKESVWGADFSKRITTHERKTNTKLVELVGSMPANTLVIDAGAHVGDTGLLLASEMKRRNNGGIVIEVDPDRSKLEFIEDTAEKNRLEKFVRTVHSGLSDARGSGSLNKSMHAGAWFVDKGTDFKLDTLDNMLSEIDGRPYLIKLDVEGHELKALRGSIRTISKYHPIIMVEILEHQLQRCEHTVRDIEHFMTSLNYYETWRGGIDRVYEYSSMPPSAPSKVIVHSLSPILIMTILIMLVAVGLLLIRKLKKRQIVSNQLTKPTIAG